jgi:hypothetical protein
LNNIPKLFDNLTCGASSKTLKERAWMEFE